MKEASPLRQMAGSVYSNTTTARDLDIVFEESNHLHQQQQQQSSPAASSLSFLRGKPMYVPNNHPSTPPPYSVMNHHELPNHSSSTSNTATITTTSSSNVRGRPRADTMPSFIHPEMNHINNNRPTSNNLALLTAIESSNRHRSGSLTLPLPPPPASFWSNTANSLRNDSGNPPLSPSSEQLLQNDSDFSIARTMRSLGLEEEGHRHQQDAVGTTTTTASQASVPINSLFHHQSPPEFHMPSRSLLSGSNRNRSYSVNAAARYDVDATSNNSTSNRLLRASSSSSQLNVSNSSNGGVGVGIGFASPLEGFTRQQQNRPRASSMGRAEAARSSMLPSPMSLLYGNGQNQQQRSSPLVLMRGDDDDEDEYELQLQQTSLSLGDSELLANLLNNSNGDGIHHGGGLNVINGTVNSSIYEQHDIMAEKPFMHYSQSTPTTYHDTINHNYQSQQASSRSLWVGNIDHSVTTDLLSQVFSNFGPIESIRLLVEKECGFVNFFQVEDAIRAKEDILVRMGGRIGSCTVRIGFGKADAVITENNVIQPTRALWLGNIPGNTTPTSLQGLFARFGTIESVRVLSHKNCGFINFVQVESAAAARNALARNEIDAPGFTSARVGFAKIPPSTVTATTTKNGNSQADYDSRGSSSANDGNNDSSLLLNATATWQNSLLSIMKQFNMKEEVAFEYVKGLKISSLCYFDTIPPVPELGGANRKFDTADLRRRIESASMSKDGNNETEIIAQECMNVIAEISSDYIGNTVIQKLFEKCSEETKQEMLEHIAPHLAAISIHKNGTWATQKIIDLSQTPEQTKLIIESLKPYVPSLLLDQFGNYAVQCCLRLGDPVKTQFIFDAMVEKLINIAQGRFGARSMRGILESECTTLNQKRLVAAALCHNAISLATNANGSLLLSWLIESTDIENRVQSIASRLLPQLTQLCTHKIGSQIVYKLVNQVSEPKAREIILSQLLHVLPEILLDQARGLVFIQKLAACPAFAEEEKSLFRQQVCLELGKFEGPGHKKLLDLLIQESSSNNNNHEDNTH